MVFSLLELKRYGETRGYVSRGFKVTDPKKIAQLKIPALTLINTRGYNHFVVIKGVKNGEVFIADPAFGNSSKPLDTFVKDWSGVDPGLPERDQRRKQCLPAEPDAARAEAGG